MTTLAITNAAARAHRETTTSVRREKARSGGAASTTSSIRLAIISRRVDGDNRGAPPNASAPGARLAGVSDTGEPREPVELTTHVTGRGTLTAKGSVIRSLNETRLAVLGIIVSIAFTVGF